MSQNDYLFVFPTALLGGAERVMFNLISYLLMRGDKVVVVIMSRGKQQGWEYIENHQNLNMIIYDYRSEKKAIIPLLIGLMRLSLQKDFKMIFSSHTHMNAVLSMLKKMGFFRKSYLVSRESTVIFERFFGIKSYIFKFFYHFMYGKQDLLICQTQNMRDSLVHHLGFIPAKRMEVLPNPVNIEYIDDSIHKNGIKEDIIVACGRLIGLKQFDLLIEAFAQCHVEFPSYKLVIIGDGEEKIRLQDKVKILNLFDKVIFTGKISNPFEWFAKAKIGVISSKIEGFPNVILEMMTSRVNLIISTPCTDGLNLLPKVNVLQDDSIDSITLALKNALNSNYDYSEVYRSYIIKERSIEAFAKKIEKIIEY